MQTDDAVFDKQGRFVGGLRPEQFELQVNGKAQAIAFFERVGAGSRREESRLAGAAARVPGVGKSGGAEDEGALTAPSLAR